MSGARDAAAQPFVATSEAQRRAWGRGEVAPAEEVRPGLWAVALPMPGDRMPSSFGYAMLGPDGAHLVDPGWGVERTVVAWQAFLAERGLGLAAIRTLLVTHGHPDHLGAAELLRERTGARILLSGPEAAVVAAGARQTPGDAVARLERWGVPASARGELLDLREEERPAPAVAPDGLIEAGEVLDLGGRRVRVHATPGHTAGHLCFVLDGAGAIMTGDHVLPGIQPGLGLGTLPGSSPLIDYLGSLRAMAVFDGFEALPGHEFRFRGIRERSGRIAEHHLSRTRAVAALVSELGDAPVWAYAARSPWSRGWERMRGFMRLSALTQTELHLSAVRSGAAAPWLGEGGGAAGATHA